MNSILGDGRDSLYRFWSWFNGLVQPVLSHPGIVVAKASKSRTQNAPLRHASSALRSMAVCESEGYTPFPAREIATGSADNCKGLVYLSKCSWMVFIDSSMPMRI